MGDSGDPQDLAEAFDADNLDDEDFPPERPMGVEEFGVTQAEEDRGEAFERRLRREDTREDPGGEPEPVGRLLPPDDQPGEDTTAEEVAVTGDPDDDDQRPEELSAEESAVHLEGE